MRWLFTILVALNIAFFLWNSSDNGGNEMARRQALHDDQMLLLGEKGETQTTEQRVAEIRARGMPNISLAEDVEEDSEPKPVDAGAKEPAASSDNPSSQPYLEPITPASPGKPSASDDSRASFGMKARCISVGPFASKRNAKNVASLFKKAGISFEIKSETSKGAKTMYRVYQGPFNTAEMGKTRRDSLTRKGITDHFARKESDGNYIISLGVFSTRVTADALVAALNGKGEKADVRAESSDSASSSVYWLNTGDVSSAAGIDKQLAKLVEKSVKSREIPCKN